MRKRLTQKERKEITRKLLLESAVEIFAKFGFHGASVDKIADHAGFSKGAVYGHFQSKEELFLALLENRMNMHAENINNLIEQEYTVSHTIEKINAYFNSVKEENRTMSMLNMEFLLYAMRKESVRDKWSGMISQSVGRISESIEVLMKKENHKLSLPSQDIAWIILSLENGMSIFHYIGENSVPSDLYGKALKTLLLASKRENEDHLLT